MDKRKPEKQFIYCPICGNEIVMPRYKDKPYRCHWCRTVITDWRDVEKVKEKR